MILIRRRGGREGCDVFDWIGLDCSGVIYEVWDEGVIDFVFVNVVFLYVEWMSVSVLVLCEIPFP